MFIQMAIPKHQVVTVDEAGLDGVSTELLYGYSDRVRSMHALAHRYGPPSLYIGGHHCRCPICRRRLSPPLPPTPTPPPASKSATAESAATTLPAAAQPSAAAQAVALLLPSPPLPAPVPNPFDVNAGLYREAS